MKGAGQTRSRNGRTATKEVRRQQLIDATIESIAERGFSGTTLVTVTKFANLSHGTVNFHFKNKESLFADTLGFLAEEHGALWRENLERSGTTPQERLLALIDSEFDERICNRKKLAVWFAFYGEARYRAVYRERCAHIDNERMAETEKLCRLMKNDGGYDHVNPRSFAKGLEAFIDGLLLNMLLYPETFSREDAREECLGFLGETFTSHFPVRVDAQNRMSR